MSHDGDYLRTARWVAEAVQKAITSDADSGAWELFDIYPVIFRGAARYMELSDMMRIGYLYGNSTITPADLNELSAIEYALEHPSREAWTDAVD